MVVESIIQGSCVGVVSQVIALSYSTIIAPRRELNSIKAEISSVLMDNSTILAEPLNADVSLVISNIVTLDEYGEYRERQNAHFDILKTKDKILGVIENYPIIHFGIPGKEDLIIASKLIEEISIVWYSESRGWTQEKYTNLQKERVSRLISILGISSIDVDYLFEKRKEVLYEKK